MPGLDDYNQFLKRREQEGVPSRPPRRREIPAPGTDSGVRYVVRGGVTIAVPADEVVESDIPLELVEARPRPPREVDLPVRPSPRIPAPALKTGVLPEEPRIPTLPPARPESDAEGARLWEEMPRHLQILATMARTEPAPPTRSFEETREQLIQRLADPTLTLEETARLLDVCTATVRRYANRGHLTHHRTLGQQRRFRLSDVLTFLEKRASRSPGNG